MRTLASIQKIVDLQPIEGADAIEKAVVLGWNVVVKKDEFKVGDLCVYFEIDSLLPAIEEFEFLNKNGKKKYFVEGRDIFGYRLKTVRLRGQISQGLCLPLSILEGKKYANDERENPVYDFKEGTDVSDLLGIVKYEPQMPASLSGIAIGGLPGWISKTDETRIQTCPKILERYQGVPFYVAEKLDGSSMTAFIDEGELHVCSRSLDIKEADDNTFWIVAKEEDLKNKLDERYAIQGELVGGKIQNNPLKLSKHALYVFNVFDREEGRYLNLDEMTEFCKKRGLTTVPIVDKEYYLPKTVDEIVAFSTFKSFVNPEVWAEGYVFRPLKETIDGKLGRLSFKVINPEFLLNE